MVVKPGRIGVAGTGKFLDTTIMESDTEAGTGDVHREGVVIGDSENLDARVAVSPLGALRASSSMGNSEITDGFPGYSIVHKFGRNTDVGSGFTPVSLGGLFRTPQVGDATALRVKAGDVNDTAGGSGARSVVVLGIGPSGDEVSAILTTAGVSAGPSSSVTFIRAYRAYVNESGTYGTATVGSHAADIIIENAAGTEDWIGIEFEGLSRSQSQTAVYTIPNGKVGYLQSFFITTATNKPVDLVLLRRNDILQTSPPYSSIITQTEFTGIQSPFVSNYTVPVGPFSANTDMGWMARVATGTASVSVDFEILLRDV